MALFEETDNHIKYDWWLNGPHGANFELYPVKGRNTQAEIVAAKAQLRKEHDVCYIRVKWVTEEEWRYMKLWFNSCKETNEELNAQYLEAYDNRELEWQINQQ